VTANVSDISIRLNLFHAVPLPDMPHKAICTLQQRVFVSISIAESAGEPGRLAMTLDHEAIADEILAVLDDFVVVLWCRYLIVDDFFDDFPRAAFFDGHVRPAQRARVGASSTKADIQLLAAL